MRTTLSNWMRSRSTVCCVGGLSLGGVRIRSTSSWGHTTWVVVYSPTLVKSWIFAVFSKPPKKRGKNYTVSGCCICLWIDANMSGFVHGVLRALSTEMKIRRKKKWLGAALNLYCFYQGHWEEGWPKRALNKAKHTFPRTKAVSCLCFPWVKSDCS